MSVHEIRHPLVKHKLGLLRQQSLSTRSFRQLTAEVGSLLTYEATSDLELEDYNVETWMGPAPAQRIKGKKVTVVPILRAGIGMLDGVLELIPSAKVSVVGVYRDEETLEPVAYFEKLAHDIDERLALVIDRCWRPAVLWWRASTCSRKPVANRFVRWCWWLRQKVSRRSRRPTRMWISIPRRWIRD